MNTLSKLQKYMSDRKALLPGALALSAMSSLMGMLPFVFVWLIVRELLKSPAESSRALINSYAWWAVGTAIGGIVIYFVALTLSHLAAFRAETNMRRRAMEKLVNEYVLHFGQDTACKMLRGRLSWFVKGMPGCSAFRKKLSGISSGQHALELIKEFEKTLS